MGRQSQIVVAAEVMLDRVGRRCHASWLIAVVHVGETTPRLGYLSQLGAYGPKQFDQASASLSEERHVPRNEREFDAALDDEGAYWV